MPHLRLYVPAEWLREDFKVATKFDAERLLDQLVQVVSNLLMENPAIEARRQQVRSGRADQFVTEEEARIDAKGKAIRPEEVPMINLSNLKHAIVPLYH